MSRGGLRQDFYAQKARVYCAWTGLAWTWQVTVPDARWCCGHEWVSVATFREAMAALQQMIAVRGYATHPWCSVVLADPNWLRDERDR